MAEPPTISESEILADVIAADRGNLPPEVARSVLNWKFTERSITRINQLADRNQKGTISEAEREQLNRYLRVGNLVNLLQAKARLSLQTAGSSFES